MRIKQGKWVKYASGKWRNSKWDMVILAHCDEYRLSGFDKRIFPSLVKAKNFAREQHVLWLRTTCSLVENLR